MYSVNGTPLDNDALGWYLLRRTQLITQVTKRLTNVEVPGRHGVLSGIAAFRGAPTSTLVVRSPGENVEALYSLFTQNNGVGYLSLTDDSTREALFELASIDAQGITAMDELVNVTITIRFPTADWRAANETTVAPSAVTGAVTYYEVLDGISADISDGSFVVLGNFGNFELVDEGSGSWLKTIGTWPFSAGTGLLYVGATGQGFTVSSGAPWTPVSDASQYLDVSGGGGFRMTPYLRAGDPTDRTARLKLTVTSTGGVSFGVRAKNAYAMRNGEV